MAEQKPARRISASTVTTVISISLVLFVLGLLGIFLLSAKKISDQVKENIAFHVYLKETKEESLERIQSFLGAASYVKSHKYISRDSAAAIYKEELGEDFVQFIGYNPLPASFEVQLRADYANPESIGWIQKQITDFSAVKEFDYQHSLLDAVNKNVNKIALVLLVFIALLLLIALALINNTIRLAIYSKRFLIKTMQLVGATGGFIRKPFLLGGIRNGFIAGAAACGLLYALIYAAVSRFAELQPLTDMKMLLYLFMIVFGSGIIISGISTFFAVRKYLRASAEELY